MFAPTLFAWFDSCTTFLVLWLTVFLGASILKLTLTTFGRNFTALDGLIGSELPGLPLALLHSVCFVRAVWIGDWASMLLFAWWGPGFVWIASLYLYVHAKQRSFDWSSYAKPTSIACKVVYVILMTVFFWRGLTGIPFVFSIWIMHDQIRLAWFHQNADRTRRLFEDAWVFRIGYAAFLWLPWFVEEFPVRALALTLGPLVTVLWIAGLARVSRAGKFRSQPTSYENLRDIVYIPRGAVGAKD